MMLIALALGFACIATDGDTLRCGDERVRLLGIDAPEMPGHCRKGRRCAPGDPYASKAALAGLIAGRRVTLTRTGRDRYGRTLAVAWVGRISLGCELVRQQRAIYVARWDDGASMRRGCWRHGIILKG